MVSLGRIEWHLPTALIGIGIKIRTNMKPVTTCELTRFNQIYGTDFYAQANIYGKGRLFMRKSSAVRADISVGFNSISELDQLLESSPDTLRKMSE